MKSPFENIGFLKACNHGDTEAEIRLNEIADFINELEKILIDKIGPIEYWDIKNKLLNHS